ncbi:CotH kinase family protein [Desulfococcaceae bacterium HSG7]|nr:CotH kinase family protein [Desulfococcaceae bacterium HSG7]
MKSMPSIGFKYLIATFLSFFLFKRKPLKKIFKISLKSATFISLPIVITMCWMVADSYLEHRRFVNIACKGKAPSFNLDIMHFYLKNGIKRAYIRATAPEMPEDETLPTIQMAIDPENLAALNADLPKSGKNKYYKAYIKYKGKSHTVKARYMGDNHWHWLYPQKSWRIKTKKKKLIQGVRKLNLKNPRTMFTGYEPISQGLAREIGLIAPRVHPIKFIVNNIYMGVYLFWDKVDESIIRRLNKMPGSVYSGDGAPPDPYTGVSLLWKDQKYWEKSASRNSEQKTYREDIKFFIKAVNNPDLHKFYSFANKYLDKDAYTAFFSLDNLTACMHHDFHHNHKIYFDPVKGKFVPISWDIDSWHLTNTHFDAVGNPLLNKWKLIPEFDLLRKKKLWDLLNNGLFSAESIITKIDKYTFKVRPALEADVHRDTKSFWYVRYSLELGKPICVSFTMAEYDNYIHSLKANVKRRVKLLTDYFNRSKMSLNLTHSDKDNYTTIRLVASGNVGRKVKTIILQGNAKNAWLYKDLNRNGSLDLSDTLVGKGKFKNDRCIIKLNEAVLPGYKKIRRPANYSKKILFGDYQLKPSPLEYTFFVKTDGSVVSKIEISSTNIVTGQLEKTDDNSISSDISNQTVSLHPWDIPAKPEKEYLTLGPGTVFISSDTIYPEHIDLTILPGTTIEMAENISIFCYGQVTAKGTADKPIRFEAAEPLKPWGVFVLQGKSASGSVFEHCFWENGSAAMYDLIYYSGMVSIHDSDNIIIRHCGVGKNYVGDDAMHLAYCKNFKIENCSFKNAKSDALDVDISQGVILHTRFNGSGNDALDFMTSLVTVRDCVFKKSGDKGVSVGEKSNLEISDSVFENCVTGIQIKDRSIVKFGENIIRGSSVGINLSKKNWRYGGGGVLEATTLYTIDCKESITIDKHSKANYTAIKTTEPISLF